MKKKLIRNVDIEVRESAHGYGVFAKKSLKKGTILEECRLIFVPFKHKVETLHRYLYEWNTKDPMRHYALPIGYGSLYNSSEMASVVAKGDIKNRLFKYITTTDVKKDEELTMKYRYMDDSKYYTKVEE